MLITSKDGNRGEQCRSPLLGSRLGSLSGGCLRPTGLVACLICGDYSGGKLFFWWVRCLGNTPSQLG